MTIKGLDKEKITYIVEKVSHPSSGITVDLGKRMEMLGGAEGTICPRCHVPMLLQTVQDIEDELESTWRCRKCGYRETKKEKK